jgi:hypothetical protein
MAQGTGRHPIGLKLRPDAHSQQPTTAKPQQRHDSNQPQIAHQSILYSWSQSYRLRKKRTALALVRQSVVYTIRAVCMVGVLSASA